MSALVIFGGTFDPFHRGHLYLAARAAAAFGGKVCVVPNGNPPHREPPVAPWQERLEMCRLATARLQNVCVSAYETPQRPRRTADILRHFKRQRPEASLLLLIGADAYRTFGQWHQPARILQLAHLLVVPRTGETLPQPLPWGKRLGRKAALTQGSGGIYLWRCHPPAVSARQCRTALAAGEDVQEMLQPPVAAHIRARGLYGGT